MNSKEAKQHIRDAATLLRNNDPQWFRKIDLERFDVTTQDCILGQLFGNFANGINLLKITFSHSPPPAFSPDTEEQDAISKAWKDFILYLKAQTK